MRRASIQPVNAMVIVAVALALLSTAVHTLTRAASAAQRVRPNLFGITTPRWNQTAGFPVDGVFLAIAVDPGDSNRLYAGVENLGFLLSRDGGVTWERHDPGHHFARGVLLDPLNESLAYYIYGAGLAVFNRNTGTQIRAAAFGSTGYTLENRAEAIVMDSNRTVYIASPAGVFKSRDEGLTVQRISQGLPAGTIYSALAIDPSNNGVIYAGTRAPWYYDSLFVGSVPSGYAGKGLFKSSDGGGTWSAAGGSVLQAGAAITLQADVNINAIAINSSNTRRVYVATSQGIYRSDDSGTSWAAVNNGLSNTAVWTLVMNPGDPNQLFAGTWGGGLFVSTDGGNSWNGSGFNGIDAHRDRIFSLAFDRRNASTLYIGTGNGLFRYNIQTKSYSHVAGTVFRSAAAALAIESSKPSTIYTLEGGAGGGRDLYRSRDGGRSWDFIGPFQPLQASRGNCLFSLDCPPFSIDHTYGMEVEINPLNANVIYYSSAYGLFVSRDGGDTWSIMKLRVVPDQTHIHAIGIYQKNPNIAYLSTGGGVATHSIFTHVLKSTDGGATWSLMDKGLPQDNYHMLTLLVDPADANTVYMASTTSGFGCQPAHDPLPKCVAVGIYKTVDGGNSWFAVNTGLESLDVLAVALDPSNSSVLYAAAGESLYVSQDAGGSWKRIFSRGAGTRVSAIAIDPRNRIMFVGTWGRAGVYVSVDGGNSWVAFNNGFADQFGVPDVQELVIDSQSGSVYAAADGVFKATYPLLGEGAPAGARPRSSSGPR